MAVEPAKVSVTASTRQYIQGGIFLITVQSTKSIKGIDAEFGRKKVNFYTQPNGKTWMALAGIDLETKTGEYPLEGQIVFIDNQTQGLHKTIRVLPGKFPVQHITVEEKYVTLSPEDQRRADEESKKLAIIWETVSAQRLWSGRFLKPIDSQLTSGFGRRRIVNSQPRNPHAGVDFKASAGEPIKAANSGRVMLSANLFFSGNTVVIDHGLGLYTYYAHCASLAVKDSEMVRKGQILGTVGATGRVTGPHLHWSCRLSGARVDPLLLTTSLLGE
jgi:murein DD-endopeptidase MepM/ murein hydrolase activator NlpD